MSISHLLETFDRVAQPGAASGTAQDARADRELAIYERGYTAGWDDCANTTALKEGDAEAEFKNNLRDFSFTYQEAYSAISKSLEPLFRHLVNVSLPKIAHESLGLLLQEQVSEVAKINAESTVEITCHPMQEARLAASLEDNGAMKTRIRSDLSLSEGQIDLRFADEERQIDLEGLNTSLQTAVDDYFNELKKEPRNG